MAKEVYDPPLPWTGEIAAPLILFRSKVRPEWIDSFDHVNIAHYLTICDHANWAFWNWINHPEGTIEARASHEYVIVENHVHYIDELALGTPIHVETQFLGFDDKRYVLFHRVFKTEGNVLAATNEVKSLGFNLRERRPERWRPFVGERLNLIHRAHAGLEMPEQAGQGIALKRR
ncbi:thioesterase family protein [Defluviimonas salinarum]|uniref:Thioesterase family protein n=1 Tax=Defluviimonas salinarum TaxID=2992147 RepID=A0ABT3J9X9_9RHOB|nr:thioesterase family protein [Defluviimonas salinarum]MCW3784338.1 thioesterase family protein [Defluviimonas salinarum]